ncbi:MAG: hypothetical protein AAGH88_07960 [Planctomycetota bacterium]
MAMVYILSQFVALKTGIPTQFDNPICYTILSGHSEADIIFTIKSHPDHISSSDSMGFYPIHRAMLTQSIPVTTTLLDRGADINQVGVYGKTPLMIAFKADNIDTTFIQFLLDGDANYNAVDDDGQSVSEYAEKVGFYFTVDDKGDPVINVRN